MGNDKNFYVIDVEDDESVELDPYPGIPYWNDLLAGEDADGNVAEEPPLRWGQKVCECGGDSAGGTHSSWCPAFRPEK